MKKIFFSLLIFPLALFLASCSKERGCTCTTASGTTTNYTIEKNKKDLQEKYCKSYESGTTTCELVKK
jgi:hypothetical protein